MAIGDLLESHRDYALGIDLATGATLDWDPCPNYTVSSITSQDDTVVMAGLFTGLEASCATELPQST